MKRKIWLDNLKLIACVAVFWGHFHNSFYGQLQDQSVLTSADKLLIFLSQHVFNIMFNGGWWVFVFCIISGWLAWKKEIGSIGKLAKTLLHRYLRFAIPVLVANVLVVIISKTIGFHSAEVGRSLNNAWLAANYENGPQAAHILKSALLLNNEFVGPLWVLLYIFVGSCALYCWKYLAGKLRLNNTTACLVILAAWPVLYYASYRYGTSWFYAVATFSGVLLNFCVANPSKDDKWNDIVSIAGVLVVVMSLNIWEFDQFWKLLSAWLFLWFSCRSAKWKAFLESSKTVNELSPISFSVYLLQGPVLLSASMIIYQVLIDYSCNIRPAFL